MDIIIFIILIGLSATFSAAETALFSIRDSQVRLMQKRRLPKGELVAKLKGDPQRLLVTLLIGNNIVNISIASFATVLAISEFGSLGAGIAAGFSTVLILLLGEIFPKTMAFAYKERVARGVALPIYIFYILLYPASTLFVVLERWFRKRAHLQSRNVISEEEIRIMVELGLEHGEIDRTERQMIENVFNFDDTPVGHITTPKDAIESLSGEVPVTQIAYFVSQSGYSRFPVHDGNVNNYIGYVHTNDVMRVLNSDSREDLLETIISPLRRISHKMKLEEVFKQMTRDRSHMYLVHKDGDTNEIIGLVTMEDILEEIMGEIEDEGDKRDRE